MRRSRWPWLPPRPFADAIVRRTVLLWVFVRSAATVGAASTGMASPSPMLGSPVSALWVVLVVVAALRVEMWRQGEIVFLANLGHSFARTAGVAAGVCSVLEVGARALV